MRFNDHPMLQLNVAKPAFAYKLVSNNMTKRIAVLVFLFSMLMLFASTSSMAQSFDIVCSNLNNNPSASDCSIVYANGSPGTVQDSQIANLANDFNEIKSCSDTIAGTTGTCLSSRFSCDITKDAPGGSVTGALCTLKNVPGSEAVFNIDCSSISATDATCTVNNDTTNLRANLPTGPVGSVLTPTQFIYVDTMLGVCDNQYGISTSLQSDCVLLETLLQTDNTRAISFIDAITPDAASAAVDATQTSLRGIGRNIAQRMSSIRRAARLAHLSGRSGGGNAPSDTNSGGGNNGGGSDDKSKDNDKQDKSDSDDDQSFLPTFDSTRWLAHNDSSNWRSHYQAQSGGGASADVTNGKLGVFVNAMGDNGDRDSSLNERGFTFSGGELTTGVDYRVGSDGFLGMAFGFTHSAGSILMAKEVENPTQESFIDVNLIVGGGQFEQDRNIIYVDTVTPANSVNQVASARYFSRQSAFNLSMGYDLASGSLSFSPYVSLTVLNSTADAYDESISDPNAPGGGLAMSMDEQSFASKTMTFGTQLSYASNHSWGVLLPQATLEWINETKGNAETVKGHFVGDPNKAEFRLPTDAVDTVYYSLGLGTSAIFPGGNTIYAFYQSYLAYDGFHYSSMNLGMRWEL